MDGVGKTRAQGANHPTNAMAVCCQSGSSFPINSANVRAFPEFCLVMSGLFAWDVESHGRNIFDNAGAESGRFVCIRCEGSTPRVLMLASVQAEGVERPAARIFSGGPTLRLQN